MSQYIVLISFIKLLFFWIVCSFRCVYVCIVFASCTYVQIGGGGEKKGGGTYFLNLRRNRRKTIVTPMVQFYSSGTIWALAVGRRFFACELPSEIR